MSREGRLYAGWRTANRITAEFLEERARIAGNGYRWFGFLRHG
jgi:hypothetical protein